LIVEDLASLSAALDKAGYALRSDEPLEGLHARFSWMTPSATELS
jgi:hypothetical protein